MTGYVVYACERLRDGLEEWAKVFVTLERAMAYINRDHYPDRSNFTFRLFKLGKEIELAAVVEEQPQPAKTTTRYEVKK